MHYVFMLSSLLLTSIFSVLACFVSNKLLRRAIFVINLSLVSAGLAYLFTKSFSLNSSIFSVLVLMQIANMYRAVAVRYGKITHRRIVSTGLLLSIITSTVFLLLEFITFHESIYLYSFSAFCFIYGVINLYFIKKNTSHINANDSLIDNDLPTVSVLIPARNEDKQLSDCIETVLSSDYPKLEIIVLDDCSQDKSSEIIKSFAQKGVRFIQGEDPKENWLAKNQAYETLANAASGDWLLFMGADVVLGPKTIKTLVNNMVGLKKTMACVMPTANNSFSQVVSPLRYFWEIALPRFIMLHPPAISTFWVIHDSIYNSSGGFSAVSQSVLPERYFAKIADIKNQYIYYRSSGDLYIQSKKNYQDQIETSERLLYPQLKKSIGRLLAMLAITTSVVALYVITVINLLTNNWAYVIIAISSLMPLVLAHFMAAIYQGFQYKIIRALLLPYLLVQELVLAYISAYRYEFSEVMWKGRNVCYPILKVIPKLPGI